jgi:hypothetical protein
MRGRRFRRRRRRLSGFGPFGPGNTAFSATTATAAATAAATMVSAGLCRGFGRLRLLGRLGLGRSFGFRFRFRLLGLRRLLFLRGFDGFGWAGSGFGSGFGLRELLGGFGGNGSAMAYERLFRFLFPFGAAEALPGALVPINCAFDAAGGFLELSQLESDHGIARLVEELFEPLRGIGAGFGTADARADLSPVCHEGILT